MIRLLSIVAVAAATAMTIPAPEGPLPVGRTRFVFTDTTRADPFEPSRRRDVDVVAFYPAEDTARSTPRAPYLLSGPEEVRSFASQLGGRALLDDVIDTPTYAALDAPPRAGRERLPLLLFSHGYTGSAAASTSLLEDLASHGFVVLSIAHPYEATAATLSDGRVVSMLDAAGALRAPTRAVFAEWKEEDSTLARVTTASTDEEKLQLLRGYLATTPRTNDALRRWVDDGRAVMAQIGSLPRESTIARAIARADTSRFGIAGHSMGGVMAAEWCRIEPRCAAALNLDGSPQYGPLIDSRLDRPMLMVYSSRAGRAGASDVIYRRAASKYYRVDVADTKHLDFTDMALWPALRARHITGDRPAADAVAVTRAVVREYFDQELRGQPSALLNGRRKYTGLSVSGPAADR